MIVLISIIILIASCILSKEGKYKRASNVLVLLAFILSAFNTDNPDYQAYLYRYTSEEGEHEWLWNFLSIPAHKMGLSFIAFRTSVVFCCFLLIHRTVNRYCGRPNVFYYFYLLFPFALDVVQTRNFIVMSLLVAAFPLLLTTDIYKRLFFSIIVIIAAGFQSIAYIYLPLAFIDLIFGKVNMKILISCFCLLFFALNYVVTNYIDVFLSFIVTNYGDADSRIENLGNAGISDIGYIMYWLFHACAALYVYWAIKHENKNELAYFYFKILFIAQVYITFTLPFIVFDSTFERFSRNLIPLLFFGIAMSKKQLFSKTPIFGNKIKSYLFIGYILTMCWMDIINGYYETIVIPLFECNLINF